MFFCHVLVMYSDLFWLDYRRILRLMSVDSRSCVLF